jgi:predicted transcriptional regulator with HTH domain
MVTLIFVFFHSRSENDNNEMKMIFGGYPVETIVDDHLRKYSCGFLNSGNGTILFGVQEVEKLFHIVGIVISQEKRSELVRKVVHKLNDFYPPVRKNLYRLKFHNVVVPPKDIVRCKKSGEVDRNGESVLILEGSAEVIARKKWPEFAKENLPEDCLSRIIPLEADRFCIVVDDPSKIPDNFERSLEEWLKKNSQVTTGQLTLKKTKKILNDLCIVELIVHRSGYPIHMIKPVETHVFQKNGELVEMKFEDIMNRICSFDSASLFDVDKFLEHTNSFDLSGQSYILIASPLLLPEHERYIAGLVIPQWTLVIDFDKQPNEIGHLFRQFDVLHDIHQIERKRVFKTQKNRNLGLNPKHVTCWFAALGDDEYKKSLLTTGKI